MQLLKKHILYACQRTIYNGIVRRYVDENSVGRESLVAYERCFRYGQAEETFFAEPEYVGRLPNSIRNAPDSWRSTRPFVCELIDAQLLGPDAIALHQNGDYVLENSLGSPKRLVMSAIRTVPSGTAPIRRSTQTCSRDTVVSLVGPWCRNYYHWLVHYLTRLQGAAVYEDETNTKPTVVVPSNPADWMVESLLLCGCDESSWEEWEGGRCKVDRLVVPSIPHQYFPRANLDWSVYATTPENLYWLRETIRSNTPDDLSVGVSDRIFVSRENASERRVLNKSEIEPILDEYGFDVVTPESFSFTEQVALFSQANAIVGPTGAGLVNSMFADDATLVTLFGKDKHPVYYVLANVFDHEFGCLTCTPKGNDLVVNPDELRTLFEKLSL